MIMAYKPIDFVQISVIIIYFTSLSMSFHTLQKILHDKHLIHTKTTMRWCHYYLEHVRIQNSKLRFSRRHFQRNSISIIPDHVQSRSILSFIQNEYMRNRHDINFIRTKIIFGIFYPFVVCLVWFTIVMCHQDIQISQV